MNTLHQSSLISSSQRFWITITVMLVAVLEVMDATIINVALPAMKASLSANTDQITWISTSYVVASAIILPLTGFLSDRIGRKRLLIINVFGFMISSVLCGAATSLTEMVFLRILQGAFGASLIPMSQSILRDTYPPEQFGKAMAIWGLGIMAAPVLGPTVGGYITENMNWRWIFYINLPICILGIFLTITFIKESKLIKRNIDFIGLILMVIGIGSLQFFLDEGTTKDWFSSNEISFFAMLSVIALSLFIYRSLSEKNPIVQLRLFANRNLAVSTILLLVLCGCIFSILTIQPIMLETLFHYPTLTTGLAMAPRGFTSGAGMILASFLMPRLNIKIILSIALLICSVGTFLMAEFTLNTPMSFIIYSGLIQGFGMGLFMVPVSTYSLATLRKQDITEGSGLFSYGRMLGTSLGISLTTTLITRETQINWSHIAGHITQFSANTQHWLAVHKLIPQTSQAAIQLSQSVSEQANMAAYIDAYFLVAVILLCLIPLALLIKHIDFNQLDHTAGGH